jgi:hypothetical protein
MLVKIALKMLAHVKTRCASAVLGVGAAFFFCAAQIDLLVGWCNTTSAIILQADADVWVMAKETCAFDDGTAPPQKVAKRELALAAAECEQASPSPQEKSHVELCG